MANISFTVSDLLLLQNSSFINARATDKGNGGNIDIVAEFVAALPNSNSDIIANAIGGNGGNIQIDAKQVFGFIVQNDPNQDLRNNTTNDISTSSELGQPGTIEIEATEDISRSFTELPIQPNNPEPLQTCQTADGEPVGSFISTGRSGIPLDPTEPLSNPDIWEDLHPPSDRTAPSSQSSEISSHSENTPDRLEVAQGWMVNDRGEVELVAAMPRDLSPRVCPLFQSTEDSTAELASEN